MARGLNIGDEVAIDATIIRRVTDDRISVSIPTYGFPHSVRDSTTKVVKGQTMELIGSVTRVEKDAVTVSLGGPVVTVALDVVRLVTPTVR
ncbi:hypothetical protein EOA13_32345 [Mesorhizobium sp. M7A.F.Ca.US.011.01.1.1]|uniref:hypothetical protein n=1 Tax=unclassified Mesorhizobium TaxID=325217 RepID=UPI000FCB2417|nr:hypothetical protein [Mesorhizobium sp. M7A.F.Ca.US.011.01.1.1]RUX23978.1 hypothetical protein EOA13_32345 [Mesorhizobium sp. M7A.F.Ca.US.011.01.1.1]